MIAILNINMREVYVNYKTLYTEWQCFIFKSLGQGSCAVATSSPENRLNNMSTLEMLTNMAVGGNINVNNLVQTIVQHPAF